MRQAADLTRHKLKIEKCGTRFMLFRKYHNAELFGETESSRITPVQLKCRSYFCPVCARKKRDVLYRRAREAMKKESWRMLTLTTVNTYDNTNDMLVKITKMFNSFLPSFKRSYKYIKYIRVLEVGKKGMVHFHILVNQDVNKEIVSRLWTRVGGGHIIDISDKISHQKALNYVLKYISKQSDNENLNNSFFLLQKRRYSFSRNCLLPPVQKGELVKIHLKSFSFSDIQNAVKVNCKDFNKDSLDFCFDYLPPPIQEMLSDIVSYYS